ncbi:hypothetical protein BG006_000928 [Podila minutissima]|uniref:Uncharacterized protein n=1 Tax=Podila minutissima TaxID=64525 RepID=A0A9P5VNX1_9FUNG|nr:hypothetical protein BG006_000928 [Podila minutissima]
MGGAYSPNSVTQTTLRQTYSIDLTTSWNITDPKYTKMKDGIYDYKFPNALMKDGVSWFAISNQNYYIYDLKTGDVTQKGPLANLNNVTGIRAAMEPTSGDMILPNGYNSTLNIASSMWFSPSESKVDSIPPYSGTAGLLEYGIVWSESAKAFFIFGGFVKSPFGSYGTVTSTFLKYDPTAKAWTDINSAGGPSARRAHCMVTANKGATLIVFGGTGQSDSLPAMGDIYLYDVLTSTWKRGFDSNSKASRAAHACAVTGDYLIAHGGYGIAQTSSPLSEMTSVYNMKSQAWESQYIAPGSSGGPDTRESPSSASGKGGIIGGAVAAVAVILAGAGFFFYRKKKKSSSTPEAVEIDPYAKASGPPHGGPHGQEPVSAPVIFGQPSPLSNPQTTPGAIFTSPLASGSVFESQPTISTLYTAQMTSGTAHNPQTLPDPNYASQPIQLTPTSQYAHLSTPSQPSPTISTTSQSVPGSMPTISPTSQYPPSPLPVVYNPLVTQTQPVLYQPSQPFPSFIQQSLSPQNPHTTPVRDLHQEQQQTELQHQIEYQEAQLQALREQQRAQGGQQYPQQQTVVVGQQKPEQVTVYSGPLIQTAPAVYSNPQYIPRSAATITNMWQSTEPTPPRNPQEIRR